MQKIIYQSVSDLAAMKLKDFEFYVNAVTHRTPRKSIFLMFQRAQSYISNVDKKSLKEFKGNAILDATIYYHFEYQGYFRDSVEKEFKKLYGPFAPLIIEYVLKCANQEVVWLFKIALPHALKPTKLDRPIKYAPTVTRTDFKKAAKKAGLDPAKIKKGSVVSELVQTVVEKKATGVVDAADKKGIEEPYKFLEPYVKRRFKPIKKKVEYTMFDDNGITDAGLGWIIDVMKVKFAFVDLYKGISTSKSFYDIGYSILRFALNTTTTSKIIESLHKVIKQGNDFLDSIVKTMALFMINYAYPRRTTYTNIDIREVMAVFKHSDIPHILESFTSSVIGVALLSTIRPWLPGELVKLVGNFSEVLFSGPREIDMVDKVYSLFVDRLIPAVVNGDMGYLKPNDYFQHHKLISTTISAVKSGAIELMQEATSIFLNTPIQKEAEHTTYARFAETLDHVICLVENFSKKDVVYSGTQLSILKVGKVTLLRSMSMVQKRSQPFCVGIWGPPGVGKTLRVPIITAALMDVLGITPVLENRDGVIIRHPPNAVAIVEGKFQENVQHSTQVILIDDMGAIAASKIPPGAGTVASYMEINGSHVVQVPKAQLEAKKGHYYQNKLTIATSNFENFGSTGFAQCEDAFARRMNVKMKLYKNEANEHVYDYSVWNENTNEHVLVAKGLDLKEALHLLKKSAKKFCDLRDDYVNNVALMAEICHECNNPKLICVCKDIKKVSIGRNGVEVIPQTVDIVTTPPEKDENVPQDSSLKPDKPRRVRFGLNFSDAGLLVAFEQLHARVAWVVFEEVIMHCLIMLSILIFDAWFVLMLGVMREYMEAVAWDRELRLVWLIMFPLLTCMSLPSRIGMHLLLNETNIASEVLARFCVFPRVLRAILQLQQYVALPITFVHKIDINSIFENNYQNWVKKLGISFAGVLTLVKLYRMYTKEVYYTTFGDIPKEEDKEESLKLREIVKVPEQIQTDGVANAWAKQTHNSLYQSVDNVNFQKLDRVSGTVTIPGYSNVFKFGHCGSYFVIPKHAYRYLKEAHWKFTLPLSEYVIKPENIIDTPHDVVLMPVSHTSTVAIDTAYTWKKGDEVYMNGKVVPIFGYRTAEEVILTDGSTLTEPAGSLLVNEPNYKGLSGSPVFLVKRDDKMVNPKLIGIISRKDHMDRTVVVPIHFKGNIEYSSIDVADAFNFVKRHTEISSTSSIHSSLSHIPELHNIGEYVGSAKIHSTKYSSAFKPSVLHHIVKNAYPDVVKNFVIPKLNPRLENGKWISPMLACTRQLSNCASITSPKPVEDCMQILMEHIDTWFDYTKPRPLTEHETIMGNGFTQAMNRKSSNGFGIKGKKNDIVVGNQDNAMFTAEFSKILQDELRRIKDTGITFNITVGTPKDEIITRDKADKGGERIFYSGNVVFLVLCRMYLSMIFEQFTANRDKSFAQVGMNAIGREFHEFLMRLSEGNFLEKMFIDGDYSKYDKYLALMIYAIRIVHKIVDKCVNFDNDTKKICHVLMAAFERFIVILGQDVFVFLKHMPSGIFATAHINCIAEMLIQILMFFFLIFFFENKRYPMVLDDHFVDQLSKVHVFFLQIIPVNYGDDNLKMVRGGYRKYYTHDAIMAFSHWLGMPITPARKSETQIYFKNVFEILFLKRTPMFHLELNRLVGLLEKTSLIKMLAFTDSDEPSWKESVMRTLSFEAALGGFDYHNEFYSVFKDHGMLSYDESIKILDDEEYYPPSMVIESVTSTYTCDVVFSVIRDGCKLVSEVYDAYNEKVQLLNEPVAPPFLCPKNVDQAKILITEVRSYYVELVTDVYNRGLWGNLKRIFKFPTRLKALFEVSPELGTFFTPSYFSLITFILPLTVTVANMVLVAKYGLIAHIIHIPILEEWVQYYFPEFGVLQFGIEVYSDPIGYFTPISFTCRFLNHVKYQLTDRRLPVMIHIIMHGLYNALCVGIYLLHARTPGV